MGAWTTTFTIGISDRIPINRYFLKFVCGRTIPMSPITEWFVLREPTTTQGNFTLFFFCFTVCVCNVKIPFENYWSFCQYSHFCFFLHHFINILVLFSELQISKKYRTKSIKTKLMIYKQNDIVCV